DRRPHRAVVAARRGRRLHRGAAGAAPRPGGVRRPRAAGAAPPGHLPRRLPGHHPARQPRPARARQPVQLRCRVTRTAHPRPAVAGPPVPGGTLRFGVLDAPANLDPHSATSYPESIIAGNITDKLTWQDPTTGTLHPWLATSWTVNPRLTEFTFHLRQDVSFS